MDGGSRAFERPLVCFVNGRSGGKQGKAVRRRLIAALAAAEAARKGGGEQGGQSGKKKKKKAGEDVASDNRSGRVFDLGEDGGPEKGLKWAFDEYSGNEFLVLVCGGDGTVGWVLGAMDRMGLWESGDDWQYLNASGETAKGNARKKSGSKVSVEDGVLTSAKKAGNKEQNGANKVVKKFTDAEASDSSEGESDNSLESGDGATAERFVRKPTPPPCAVLPLGTGNDMSRALGWGPGYDGSDVWKVLVPIQHRAVPVWVDRWKITFRPLSDDEFTNPKFLKKHQKLRAAAEAGSLKQERAKEAAQSKLHSGVGADGSSEQTETSSEDSHIDKDDSARSHNVEEAAGPAIGEVIMCNYFSIGGDAEVALSFHTMREKHRGLFASRVVNKGWYGVMTAKSILKIHDNIADHVHMSVDDENLTLADDIRALVILNLPSWSAGVDLWGRSKDIAHHNEQVRKSKKAKRGKEFQPQRIDDHKCEVVGLRGYAHMGATQVGLKHGNRLAQGSNIRFVNELPIPAQVDGEPWMLPPSETVIQHYRQSIMLFNPSTDDVSAELTEISSKGPIGGTPKRADSKSVASSKSSSSSRKSEQKTSAKAPGTQDTTKASSDSPTSKRKSSTSSASTPKTDCESSPDGRSALKTKRKEAQEGQRSPKAEHESLKAKAARNSPKSAHRGSQDGRHTPQARRRSTKNGSDD